MKKFLTIFFIVLGAIFFVLILLVGLVYFVDPFGIKDTTSSGSLESMFQGSAVEDKNPTLSPTQEKALQTIGIDPATVPASFTEVQIKCFVEKLGQARVDEIKAGSSPTMSEYLKAKDCI